MKSRILFVTFLSVLITACSSTKRVATIVDRPVYKQYKVDSNAKGDTNISAFLRPYSIEVSKQMNVVIGETESALERKMPEGTLGNFVSDAMKERAAVSYNRGVDAAFVNYGGLRVDNIAPGPIKLGKMYELMPFDNIVVLLHLKGAEFMQILNTIASKKGWPIAGVQMQIRNDKAVNVLVGGEPIQNDSSYTIATTDYTANGNEGFEFLKAFKQENNGYLFRDALIDFVKSKTNAGKKISATIENRITNAE